MEPELVADYECMTGEGPLWHPGEQRVYWVDIPQGRLFWYDPATGQHKQCLQTDLVGGFTIQDDEALLLFMARGAVRVWQRNALRTVIEDIPDERATRFNDVIADPVGRVFCGTMPTKERLGRLYRLDTDGKITKLLDGIGCSNGMGFTPDRKHMYYTDTGKREIYLFDYDQETVEKSSKHWTKGVEAVAIQERAFEGVGLQMRLKPIRQVWKAWDGVIMTDGTACGFPDVLLRV